ncbi:MAG: hypothetical protein AAGH43_05980 [Pseudomonadota bacterium]
MTRGFRCGDARRCRRALASSAFLALIAAALLPAGAFAQEADADTIVAEEASLPDPEIFYQAGLEAEWSGDYAAARAHYGDGIAQGHAGSHYQLGFLLMDGLGGPRETVAAREHFRAAADGGINLALVPYLYAYDDQDDPELEPDPFIAARALLELSQRDLASAGDTIMFWSPPLRRQIQVYLRDTGHYGGAIDGLIGQGSLRALRAFARSRTPLPALPERRFERLVINADGIAVNARTPIAFSAIDDLVEARSAMLGVSVSEADDGVWRIAHDGDDLLYWRRADGEDASRFELPGKPSATALAIGSPFSDLTEEDTTACALRVVGNAPHAGFYQRRCETRIEGVQLVFLAGNGPFDDLDAENGVAADPFGEQLTAIEIVPPLALRLADGEAD